jgi:hypothetical protein
VVNDELDVGAPPTVFGLIAKRLKMTEGQLYSLFIVITLTLLLAFAGLPGAHKQVGQPSSPSVPTIPAPSGGQP